jgi:hypothetical protein
MLNNRRFVTMTTFAIIVAVLGSPGLAYRTAAAPIVGPSNAGTTVKLLSAAGVPIENVDIVIHAAGVFLRGRSNQDGQAIFPDLNGIGSISGDKCQSGNDSLSFVAGNVSFRSANNDFVFSLPPRNPVYKFQTVDGLKEKIAQGDVESTFTLRDSVSFIYQSRFKVYVSSCPASKGLRTNFWGDDGLLHIAPFGNIQTAKLEITDDVLAKVPGFNWPQVLRRVTRYQTFATLSSADVNNLVVHGSIRVIYVKSSESLTAGKVTTVLATVKGLPSISAVSQGSAALDCQSESGSSKTKAQAKINQEFGLKFNVRFPTPGNYTCSIALASIYTSDPFAIPVQPPIPK